MKDFAIFERAQTQILHAKVYVRPAGKVWASIMWLSFFPLEFIFS